MDRDQRVLALRADEAEGDRRGGDRVALRHWIRRGEEQEGTEDDDEQEKEEQHARAELLHQRSWRIALVLASIEYITLHPIQRSMNFFQSQRIPQIQARLGAHPIQHGSQFKHKRQCTKDLIKVHHINPWVSCQYLETCEFR